MNSSYRDKITYSDVEKIIRVKGRLYLDFLTVEQTGMKKILIL